MQNDKSLGDNVLDAAFVGAVPPDCVAVILYTTFPNHEAAVAAGRSLVEGRLAGCVNVLPAMTAIYIWQGQTETAAEAVLLAKMVPDAFPDAAAAVRRMHPYETPAILCLPVAAASADYLSWLRLGTSI